MPLADACSHHTQTPDVLTLHYRTGADPEKSKRRTYKVATKDTFVASLQLHLERFR